MSRTVEIVPAASNVDLTVTGLTMNPATPARAPGATFDAGKSADDTLLTGSQAVGGLDPGESCSGAVTVTIPASTPLNT